MRTVLRFCGILLIPLLVCSCSHSLRKPDWTFEKSAVRIHVRADNNLNIFNNRAHTLFVCFYQLRDVNAFDRLSADVAGIRQLLECRLLDDSMAMAYSKVIHPGENISLNLDRAERARHIGIVAGYSADLSGERVTRRHKFQVEKKKESLIKKVYNCVPCEMDLEVALGPGQIEYTQILTKPKVTCLDECE
jgi:type VI secretion system VasD/TssJ family lipoprotein